MTLFPARLPQRQSDLHSGRSLRESFAAGEILRSVRGRDGDGSQGNVREPGRRGAIPGGGGEHSLGDDARDEKSSGNTRGQHGEVILLLAGALLSIKIGRA